MDEIHPRVFERFVWNWNNTNRYSPLSPLTRTRGLQLADSLLLAVRKTIKGKRPIEDDGLHYLIDCYNRATKAAGTTGMLPIAIPRLQMLIRVKVLDGSGEELETHLFDDHGTIELPADVGSEDVRQEHFVQIKAIAWVTDFQIGGGFGALNAWGQLREYFESLPEE